MTVTESFFLVLEFLVGPFMFMVYGILLVGVALELDGFTWVRGLSVEHPFWVAAIKWAIGFVGVLVALTCLFYVVDAVEFVHWRF